jgi:hypothetical protein
MVNNGPMKEKLDKGNKITEGEYEFFKSGQKYYIKHKGMLIGSYCNYKAFEQKVNRLWTISE